MKLYLNPNELAIHPIGLALSGPISQISVSAGAVDTLLGGASEMVDLFCNRRIGKPGSSVISSGGVASGALSLNVDSTLTLDTTDEQAVIIAPGTSTQEIIPLEAGGVTLTTPTTPYPGTLNLALPTQYAHAAGTVVQFTIQEVSQAGSASMNDPFDEAYMSQQAQMARGHAPGMMRGMTRTVFLKSYPIGAILAVEHSYSYNNEFVEIDPTTLILEPALGYYKFALGTVVTPKGMIRTTYSAGFRTVPGPVKMATAYYFASLLQPFFNMGGAMEAAEGKVRYKWSDGRAPAWYVQQAENTLIKANLKRES